MEDSSRYVKPANLLVKVAWSEEEARAIAIRAGVAPCWTLIVNGVEHPDPDVFLVRVPRPSIPFRLRELVRRFFNIDAAKWLEREGMRVRRCPVGHHAFTSPDDAWDRTDALLLANDFRPLALLPR